MLFRGGDTLASGGNSGYLCRRPRLARYAGNDGARSMPRFKSLPYRPCVGMVVFNRKGRVFIGRRIDGP